MIARRPSIPAPTPATPAPPTLTRRRGVSGQLEGGHATLGPGPLHVGADELSADMPRRLIVIADLGQVAARRRRAAYQGDTLVIESDQGGWLRPALSSHVAPPARQREQEERGFLFDLERRLGEHEGVHMRVPAVAAVADLHGADAPDDALVGLHLHRRLPGPRGGPGPLQRLPHGRERHPAVMRNRDGQEGDSTALGDVPGHSPLDIDGAGLTDLDGAHWAGPHRTARLHTAVMGHTIPDTDRHRRRLPLASARPQPGQSRPSPQPVTQVVAALPALLMGHGETVLAIITKRRRCRLRADRSALGRWGALAALRRPLRQDGHGVGSAPRCGSCSAE
jgi:hypothetical protein